METKTVEGKEYSTAKIREDLLADKLSVPVGEGFYGSAEPLPYRWLANDEWEDDEYFEVFLNGKWEMAESIDFEY